MANSRESDRGASQGEPRATPLGDPWQITLGGTARSPEDVEALYALGLKVAEVPFTGAEAFEAMAPALLRLRKTLGISYLCHGPREGNPNDMETLEHVYLPKLRGILSLMPSLGMPLLTIHFWMDARFVSEACRVFKIHLLQRTVSWAVPLGIGVCLENLSERAGDLEEVLEAVPGLGLTLDLGHGELLSPVNTALEIIERYPGRIRHVHAHDNRGGTTSKDDLHLPVGSGIVPFGNLFRMLYLAGYRGSLTLELRPEEIGACLGRVKALIEGATAPNPAVID